MLAHAQPDVVRDSIASFLQESGSECILFDGGVDRCLSRQLDIELCPYSMPIRYARNHYQFHYGVMRYLFESGRDYQFLVCAEPDMCMLKPGFTEFLCRSMANSEYMSTYFHEVFDSPQRFDSGWYVGASFLSKWKTWSPHFPNLRYPYGCVNPGQVFRKEYVDRIFRRNILPEIMAHAERSALRSLEEVIWPTLAASYAINPIMNPGSHGIRIGSFSSEEMKRFARDPNVFMLHKMSMRVSAPDREFVRSVWNGKKIDSFSFYPARDTRSWAGRTTSALVAQTKLNVKSIYYRMVDG